jgi:hypothetical protein
MFNTEVLIEDKRKINVHRFRVVILVYIRGGVITIF